MVRGVNPATEEELWDAPIATRADLDDAVVAGKRAFGSWSQTPLEERRRCLSKFRDLIEKYKDDLAQVIMAETGKTVRLTYFQIPPYPNRLSHGVELLANENPKISKGSQKLNWY